MKYVGYMVSEDGYIPIESIGWSKSLPLVRLFLKSIGYLDSGTYHPEILESKYGNFEDIKKLELNGFLDLDTAITVKESKDKKVKIVTTSSQIDILTADFNVFSRDEYCRDKEYLNKLFNCASFIQDKQIKYELQDCVKLVYKKYRVFSDNTAEIDLIKWVVMSNYILPIK